jgi:hypothetical protein
MLNIMIIEGYVNQDVEIINNPNDDKRFMAKFRVATLNGFSKTKNNKYIWVSVVCFCDEARAKFLKDTIKRDDYVSVVGEYSLMRNGKTYYPQLVLQKIDKKFSKGEVPTMETVDITDNALAREESEW